MPPHKVLTVTSMTVAFCAFLSSACKADLTVTVYDRDTGKGIAANVSKIVTGPPPKPIFIGTSENSGVLTTTLTSCELGDTLTAKPLSADYAAPFSPVACSGRSVKIPLTSLALSERIKAIALQSEKAGNYAIAAQAFTELNARQPNASIEQKAYVNTAKALGLPGSQAIVMDDVQQKSVPSSTLVAKIRDYQKGSGLSPTGKISSRTLSNLAGGSVNQNVLTAISR